MTGFDLLTYLPLEISEKIIKNTHSTILSCEYISLKRLIDESMTWSGTPEGSTYWGDIYNNAANDVYDKKEMFPIY